MANTLRHGTHPADDIRHEGISRPDHSEPLNPVVGWSIVLLISLGLWWGLWLAASSLL